MNLQPLILALLCFSMCSCTVYTEKRSQALSQAVYATKDSVNAGRFDLASQYGEEAARLAFPPKKRISVAPITTSRPALAVSPKTASIIASVSPVVAEVKENVLRVVVPDKFRNAELLVEGSAEWQELIKNKEFAAKLEIDLSNLNKLKSDVDQELEKQLKMNNTMVNDLNTMQKKLIQKDLVILKLWISLIGVITAFGVAVYLRIKGIL